VEKYANKFFKDRKQTRVFTASSFTKHEITQNIFWKCPDLNFIPVGQKMYKTQPSGTSKGTLTIGIPLKYSVANTNQKREETLKVGTQTDVWPLVKDDSLAGPIRTKPTLLPHLFVTNFIKFRQQC
jgi:hypothetical protein